MENLFFTKNFYIFALNKTDTMRPRTSEEIKALLLKTKQRKESERQQKCLEKQKQYQLLCKQADKLLKEALQEEKKRQMDNIKALSKKVSQKPLKQPQIEFEMHIYHSNLIEREPNDRDLYLTREELMAAEERGEGEINWSKFDQLVNKVRKELESKRH